MSDEYGDKTEPATERRRLEERRRGNVARSGELNLAGHLLSAALIVWAFGAGLVEVLGRLLALSLRTAADRPTGQVDYVVQIQELASWSAEHVGEWLAAIVIAAVAVNLAQVGFLLTTDKLTLNVAALNPVTGLQRLFSIRSAATLVLSVSKFAVLLSVAAWFIQGELPLLMSLHAAPVGTAFSVIGQGVVRLSLWLASVITVLGAADYAFQKWKHERDLMMTKEEIQRESKEQDGDPLTKRRRRETHRRLVESPSLGTVQDADFVLVDATGSAMAFQYDSSRHQVPILLARGVADIASRMLEQAREHGLPLIERTELVRQLERQLTVGQGIPVDQYPVFMEILEYVYKITGR